MTLLHFIRPLTWPALLFLATLAGLTSCASAPQPQACQESDWYEIGRREGANGLPIDRATTPKPRCQGTDLALVEDLFANGHYKGLLEFCNPQNGFELGKSGQNYSEVCPRTHASEFIRRYRAGQQFFSLEQENRRIDEEMESIFTRLNRQNLDNLTRGSLRAELGALQKNRARNEKRLNQLEQIQYN